ncbi:OB-fold nucleic acid binding domain-containing protein [Streptomyces bohaiensis]|uniref:OB-fold nucleic acid binding domain-containing protein n=1 Tax=Streptomyces bohaiensis TaxID=1431344 RepID=A0ABX1C8G9_9ACTN|nr:OB-fold nucleic acid binding domain-containing protein [Streptomyces bohaiensis]NJQ13389.1 OB-fold nucleic acid binding domain-containing protein [Streptomyces bohaiensis]
MTRDGRHPARPGWKWWLPARPDPTPEGLPPQGDGLSEADRRRISECRATAAGRPVVTVSGTLRAVGTQPVGGAPALRAELDDGTASLDVVWLGRDRLSGVVPGRLLTASGRMANLDGHPVLFNPRYELRPPGTEKCG